MVGYFLGAVRKKMGRNHSKNPDSFETQRSAAHPDFQRLKLHSCIAQEKHKGFSKGTFCITRQKEEKAHSQSENKVLKKKIQIHKSLKLKVIFKIKGVYVINSNVSVTVLHS